ncbi:MAG: hypothetical protein ACRC62_20295 [Microcoleus sp.]
MQYLIFAILIVIAYHTGHRFGYQKGWGDRREWFAKNAAKVKGGF